MDNINKINKQISKSKELEDYFLAKYVTEKYEGLQLHYEKLFKMYSIINTELRCLRENLYLYEGVDIAKIDEVHLNAN
jgi:hypothetical protein